MAIVLNIIQKTLITETDKHDKVVLSCVLELQSIEQHLNIMSDQDTESLSLDQEQIKKQFEMKLMEAMQDKEAAENQARDLAEELKALRSVMELHIDQIQAAQSADDDAENTALKRELQLIREQAEADISNLHQQLRAAETKAATEMEANAGMVAKEIKSLQKALVTEKEHLKSSARVLAKLKRDLAERDKEIKSLKAELEENRDEVEEAKFQRVEAEMAQKQVEGVLYSLREQIETSNLKNALEAERSAKRQNQVRVSGGTARFSAKTTLIGVSIGVVLITATLVGVTILSDDFRKIVKSLLEGELIAINKQGGSNRSPDSFSLEMKRETETALNEDFRPKRSGPSPVTKPIFVDKAEPKPLDTDDKKIADIKNQIEATKVKRGILIQDPLQIGGNAPAMVEIHGGVFTMGNIRSQVHINEMPAHEVRIQNFLMSLYEVTFEQYETFARATGRSLPADNGWGRGNMPVINVSWYSATAYAKWLSDQTGKVYRLPTEAEWEYAAAGGTNTPYWWGYKIGKENANCFNCGSRWDGQRPAPVGSFKSNSYGVHNTAGNVMEWVHDCYRSNYRGAPTDGSAWLDTACSKRVVRGGAFNKPGDSLKTTRRRGERANAKFFAVGFRVVRDL